MFYRNRIAQQKLDLIYDIIRDRPGITTAQVRAALGTHTKDDRLLSNLLNLEESGKIRYANYGYYPATTD